MALPKLVSPTYELTLESTGQTLNYRPFLVKEEKILLMAMESNEERDMVNATKQIINNCVSQELDVDQLPMFDMEYIFLNLRAKSVGEVSQIGFGCPNCEAVNQFNIPLDKVEIKRGEGHKNEIKLTEDVGLIMRYPKVEMMNELQGELNENDVEGIFKIIENCVDCVFDSEETYKLDDYSDNEKKEFFESLTQEQFNEVREFFDTMPKLTYDLDYKCQECGHEEVLPVEGLQNFFA